MQQRSTTGTLKRQVMVLIAFIALFWLLEIIDVVSGNRLDRLGIRPRDVDGLRGILFAPWLHFGFAHVAANTPPFFVLAWLVMLRGWRIFVLVTLLTIFIGGGGTWLIGAPQSIHLGASLLIFGYFGYLVMAGLLERSLQSLSLMMIVIMLYGSLIWGIFPIWLDGISWEGHLAGFVGGWVAALLLRSKNRSKNDFDQQWDRSHDRWDRPHDLGNAEGDR